MEYTRELLSGFIQIYKDHPCLWKVKHPDYTNKILKRCAYKALTDYLKSKNISSADEILVKHKIQSLRGAFRKEARKIETAAENGEVYMTSLWYYDMLLFTKDQDSHPSKHSDRKSDATPKKRPHADLDDPGPPVKIYTPPIAQSYDHYAGSSSSRNSKAKEDEFDAIGTNFVAKLRRMSPTQQIFAEALMHKIVMMGLLNKLTESTDIQEDSSANQIVQKQQPTHFTECPDPMQTPSSSITRSPIFVKSSPTEQSPAGSPLSPYSSSLSDTQQSDDVDYKP